MQPLVPRNFHEQETFSKLPARRKIIILGSTGSIGKAALEIVEQYPEHFDLIAIVAYGSNPDLFAQQIKKFSPKYSVIIKSENQTKIEFLTGRKILCGQGHVLDLCKSSEIDVVLAAIVGAAGLAPVITALEAGKVIALANKESLVVGGELVRNICDKIGPRIIPVDSEHSALFQCLMGHRDSEVSSLILTASGGPFLRSEIKDLYSVTPKEAIKHPRWQMGPKISVDSATLVNKALELIEAYYLYGVSADKLSAIIHPQSIVHAIVNFKDGTSLFQASIPDMKEPIAFALNYPKPRLEKIIPNLDFSTLNSLLFEEVEHSRFPAVGLALNCIKSGGLACLILNEANEYAVARFLEGSLRFVDIVPFIEDILSKNISASIRHISDIYELQAEILRLCDFVLTRFRLG